MPVRQLWNPTAARTFVFDYCAMKLLAFQESLSKDAAVMDSMKRRAKLRTLCEKFRTVSPVVATDRLHSR